MEPSSAGQGKWRRQSERRTPNCRSDKTTIQRNDVPRGTMDETSSLWTLVSIALPRSVREVRLFRLFLLIPCWESQRLIPKRSAGPRATKIGVVSLKALDHHRPNREKSFILQTSIQLHHTPSCTVTRGGVYRVGFHTAQSFRGPLPSAPGTVWDMWSQSSKKDRASSSPKSDNWRAAPRSLTRVQRPRSKRFSFPRAPARRHHRGS